MLGRLRRETSGRLLAGLAVTMGLLVPLAVFGAPAFARTGASASEYEYSSSAQYQYKITICHLTHSKKHPAHTIRISSRAWPAHRRHGDHLGECTGNETPLSKHNHGKRHGHDAAWKASHHKGRGHDASANASFGKNHANGKKDHGSNGHSNNGHDG